MKRVKTLKAVGTLRKAQVVDLHSLFADFLVQNKMAVYAENMELSDKADPLIGLSKEKIRPKIRKRTKKY